MQNNKNERVDWRNLVIAVLVGSVIGFLNGIFQLSELYVEIPIIAKYLNWLDALQDIISPAGFIAELFVKVMFLLPHMGIVVIMGLFIKHAAKYAKKLM